jgi:hypothetical protein
MQHNKGMKSNIPNFLTQANLEITNTPRQRTSCKSKVRKEGEKTEQATTPSVHPRKNIKQVNKKGETEGRGMTSECINSS